MPGPDGETQEDDGVLLGMVFDGENMRTSLAVSAVHTEAMHDMASSGNLDMSWRRLQEICEDEEPSWRYILTKN